MRGGRTQHVLGTDETGGWIRGQVLSKANLCFFFWRMLGQPCAGASVHEAVWPVSCIIVERKGWAVADCLVRHRRQVAGTGDRWQA